MPITKALLFKGFASLGAVGAGGYGIFYTFDHYYYQLSKFDRGLLDWLDSNGNDIVFSVKKGENASEELDNNTFPDFSGTATTEQTATIKVQVSTNTSAPENIKGTDKTVLTKLNGGGSGTDWTWICELKFTKDTADTANELADKDKLVNESEGFFNKLKKDISTTDDKEVRELKKKFIRNCAKARGNDKNKELDKGTSAESNKEVKTPAEKITFKLKKGDTTKKDRDGSNNQDAGKLYFENENDFNKWFKTTNNQ